MMTIYTNLGKKIENKFEWIMTKYVQTYAKTNTETNFQMNHDELQTWAKTTAANTPETASKVIATTTGDVCYFHDGENDCDVPHNQEVITFASIVYCNCSIIYQNICKKRLSN